MKQILLDANVVIALLNGRPPEVRVRLAQELDHGAVVYFSSVVDFELRYGISKSQRRALNEASLDKLLSGPYVYLDFGREAALQAAEIRAGLERMGTPIGAYDLQIAGQALAFNLTVATANLREFQRVSGLKVESWTD